MATIVGVRIKNTGKLFYFSPAEIWPEPGDKVIVETSRGMVMGDVIIGVKRIPDENITIPLKPVLRIATKEDIQHQEENDRFAIEAFGQCKAKIIEHNLDMKLVGVEPMFDNTKIMFYFTANQRVDFRDLVKDLASIFRMRIELRQIGVRDEAKMLSTLGICGKPICCSKFLGDIQPVTIKMAKEQSLSLNPTKISGSCGRLMCCLKFEQDYYEKMHRLMPKVGKTVTTPEGSGIVGDVNAIRETVTVKIVKGDISEVKTFTLDQVTNPEKYKAEEKQTGFTDFEMFIKNSKEDNKQSKTEQAPRPIQNNVKNDNNRNFNKPQIRKPRPEANPTETKENPKIKTFADMKNLQKREDGIKPIAKDGISIPKPHKNIKPTNKPNAMQFKKPNKPAPKPKTNWQSQVEQAINKSK